jgi:hypothetical protein
LPQHTWLVFFFYSSFELYFVTCHTQGVWGSCRHTSEIYWWGHSPPAKED